MAKTDTASNIAIITRADLFPPVHGAAVRVLRVAEALALQGSRVCIVTEDRDAYLRRDDRHWTRVPYPLRIRAMEEWPPLPRMTHLAEALCGAMGYPREEFPLYRAMLDPAWWLRAITVGRTEGIHVFQAEFPGFAVPAILAARLLGKRSVLVQHNVEFQRLRETTSISRQAFRRLRAVETQILKAVDRVIAVSLDDRDRMVAVGVPPDKIAVVPHGVDLEPFREALSQRHARAAEIRRRHGIPADSPLLLFHGVLHYQPNAFAVRFIAEELLPALLPRHPHLKILVAGMNPPTYYDHPALIFPGVVDDLHSYVVACDVAICPLWHGGGTRLKILEYLAGGRALVSTTKGAEGLLCRDGRELVLADTASEFADSVSRLLLDPEGRAELGRRALDFAAGFGWEAMARAHLSAIGGGSSPLHPQARPSLRVPRHQPRHTTPLDDPTTAVDAHIPHRRPSKPLTMLLMINRICNLSCEFCHLDGGALQDSPISMSEEVENRALEGAVAIGAKVLVITGGEPLLHPRCFRIVRRARESGMSVNITTNGLLVPKRLDEIIESGTSSISVSLDGMKRIHDRLRGRQGAWKSAMAALEILAPHTEISLSIYSVATNRNLADLRRVWELSRDLGAAFDMWPVNDSPGLWLTTPEQRQAYERLVDDLSRMDPHVASRRDYLLAGLDYHAGQQGRVRCLGLVEQLGITPGGDLLPCCLWQAGELKVGNILESPLAQLWTGPKARRFREFLFNQGCPVGCHNHSLWEFTRSTGLPFRLS